jgi:glycosyltransferase involved in cell wall biosynthesis
VTKVRVALVSTAGIAQPGSMRAYANVLADALSQHAAHVDARLIELQPDAADGVWARRLQTMTLPLRARRAARDVPDVWHVLDGSRAHVASALRGAPVVVTIHDVIPWLQGHGALAQVAPIGEAARLLWRRNGRSFREAAAVVCDSARTAADAQQAFAVRPERCHVVPLPVRPALLGMRGPHVDTRPSGVVLHVGGDGFYKNRAGVLRLFARLDGALAKRLVMAGPAPPRELRGLADSLGIGPRVEWVRNADDAALAACYARARVLLFPSLYEGFGWPPLEAMAFGVPVVASDRGSLPEVVGDAGRCLPLDDEAGMVAAVETLLRCPDAWREASARGSARAAQFTLQRMADGVVAAYDRALHGRTEQAAL